MKQIRNAQRKWAKMSRAMGRSMKMIILLWFVLLPGVFLLYALRLSPPSCPSKISQTKTTLRTLRTAIALFEAENPGLCPSFDALVRAGLLENTAQRDDAWGARIVIECTTSGIRITSMGKDGKMNTEDDMVSTVELQTNARSGSE